MIPNNLSDHFTVEEAPAMPVKRNVAPRLFNKDSAVGKVIIYTAENNPNGVRKLAYQHGYPAPINLRSRVLFLNQFLKENPDDKGIAAFFSIHPDLEMITDVITSSAQKQLNNYYGEETHYKLVDDLQDHDGFVGAIANLANTVVSKVGTGKKGQARASAAEQDSLRANTLATVIQQKQQEQLEKQQHDAKIKKIALYGGLGLLAIVVIVVGIILIKRYGSK